MVFSATFNMYMAADRKMMCSHTRFNHTRFNDPRVTYEVMDA